MANNPKIRGSSMTSTSQSMGDSIVLEEEIDPNYEPSQDEVLEYAKWLGMDLDHDKELFWVAREGLKVMLHICVCAIIASYSPILRHHYQTTGNLAKPPILMRYTTLILQLVQVHGITLVMNTIVIFMTKKRKS